VALVCWCWLFTAGAVAAPPTPRAIDAAEYGLLDAIACPSVSQCTALDVFGGVTTFDPVSGAVIARGAVGSLSQTSLSCPSVSQCTAASPARDVVTFDPTRPQAPTFTDLWALATNPQLAAPVLRVACHSTAQCVANDSNDGLYPFDPSSPASLRIVAAEPVRYAYVQLTCESASVCILLNNLGYEMTIDPQTGTILAHTRIYSSTPQPRGPHRPDRMPGRAAVHDHRHLRCTGHV
jgi:hypothetical protein